MKTKLLILLIIFFTATYSFAQKDNIYVNLKEFKIKDEGWLEAKTHIKYGEIQYRKDRPGGYLKALKHFLKAQEYNSENAAPEDGRMTNF